MKCYRNRGSLLRLAAFLLSLLLLLPAAVTADQSVTLTLAGDCTLGSEELTRGQENSFDSVVAREGLLYPFQNFRFLFDSDDCTIVNLEGVLSDSSSGENTAKTYRFRGPSGFAELLTLNSIEAVGLANNHVGDYGSRGLLDTQRILDENGVGWFRTDHILMLKKGDLKIAFFAIDTTTVNDHLGKLRNEIRRMKLDGEANAIVVLFHGGTEYDACHNEAQEKLGRSFINHGADLVVMHHPHVVQGVLLSEQRPVLYSLGNFVFGGNSEIRTEPYRSWEVTSLYCLVARVRLDFSDDGTYLGQDLTLYPSLISGDAPHNNYQPLPADRESAERIREAVQFDTLFELPEITEEDGRSVLHFPYLEALDTH